MDEERGPVVDADGRDANGHVYAFRRKRCPDLITSSGPASIEPPVALPEPEDA